jgi:hypothetical protein
MYQQYEPESSPNKCRVLRVILNHDVGDDCILIDRVQNALNSSGEWISFPLDNATRFLDSVQ